MRSYGVLIVDDSDDDRFFLRNVVDRLPRFSVAGEVRDGDEAMAYLSGAGEFENRAKHPMPDLMLLDLNMPRKTGFDVLRWLKTQSFPALTVVVLSGSALQADVPATLPKGAHAYRNKTAEMPKQNLNAREIEQLLEKRWQRSLARARPACAVFVHRSTMRIIEKHRLPVRGTGRVSDAQSGEITSAHFWPGAWAFGRELFSDWRQSNTPRLGAALAYYSVFAIAPLFLLTLSVAGIWFGQDAARREIFGQVQQLVGREGVEAVESLVTAASNQPRTGAWTAALAFGALTIAATGVFVELQSALNMIWRVKSAPQGAVRGLMNFLKSRLLSFAMLLGVGFLLLTSLVVSASLSALGSFAGEHFLAASTRCGRSPTFYFPGRDILVLSRHDSQGAAGRPPGVERYGLTRRCHYRLVV